MPRLWNEVHPDARYLSGKKPGQRSKHQLYGEHEGHLPFTPYVEKEVWKPHELVSNKLESYIDINIIRNWIDTCTNLHGTCCDWLNARSHEPAQAMFLIDVDNLKLIPAAPGIRYVAVSYVWGQENADASSGMAACMTSKNLPELLKDNSLVSSGIFVAQVVRDAMDLVRNLNEKFLWVDKLCIPQDDGSDKQSQLNAMAFIYANAWLTITAAQNSDANQGLYGDRQVIDPAFEEPTIAIQAEYPHFMDSDEYLTNQEIVNYNARALMCSQWFSRGWTFQEHISSRRRLLFHNNIIGWECQISSWHESQDISDIIRIPTPLIPNPSTGLQSMVDNSWPDFYRYARFTSMYNRRALTYPEDAFDGARGIFSLLARSYTGVNISGLPEMFFNAALLWQPWVPMTRRKAKRCAQEDAFLPSWSWIGWSGDVNTESWALAYSYLHPTEGRGIDPNKFLPLKIVKTVDWGYSQSLNSERRKIIDSSLEYRLSGNEILHRDGWTERKVHNAKASWQHRSDPAQRFWYPIPTVEKLQANRQGLVVRAPFIHGKTRRAFFNLGDKIERARSSNCMALELINPADKQWAGFLRLNLFFSDNCPIASDRCELIELSAGSFEAGRDGHCLLDEWNRLIPSIWERDYEFYNVLCIKWKKLKDCTVAYRRALGRVEKSQWDSVATEFDVTLA